MLTITGHPKNIQWDPAHNKDGNSLKVQEAPPKPTKPPVDEVTLQQQAKKVAKDEEYLVATYWG